MKEIKMDEEKAKIESIQAVDADSGSETQSNLPIVDESIDNVEKSTIGYLKRHAGYVVIAVAATIILEIALYFLGVEDGRIYILPLIIPVAGYGTIKSRVQQEFMQQFAAANSFTYSAKGDMGGLDGVQFKIGYSKSVNNVVSGNFENCPISLFDYKYTVGAGKSSTTYSCTIFKLQFDTRMPDMLLRNNRHDFGELFPGKINLKLEGDFNKYFTLSVPAGFEVEALEVFTPDVMAELIEKAQSFSLEIIDDHMFICAYQTIASKKDLYAFYNLAEYIVKKLGPVLARMKSSAAAMQDVIAGTTTVSDNDFNKKTSVWSIAAVILSAVVVFGILSVIVLVSIEEAKNKADDVVANVAMPAVNSANPVKPDDTFDLASPNNPTSFYSDINSGMSMEYYSNWKQEAPQKDLTTFSLLSGNNLLATVSMQEVPTMTPDQLINQWKATNSENKGTVMDEKDFIYTMQDGANLIGQQIKFKLPQTGQQAGIDVEKWLIAVPYKNNLYVWLYMVAADNFDKFKPDAVAMLNTWKIAR